jgi:Mlc titration factor MtfA (ptsG expression regulator)
MDLIILLFVIIVLGGLLYAVLLGLGRIITLLFGRGDWKSYRFDNLSDPVIDRILSENFRYYRNLPSQARPAFVARVREFMNSKEFIGKEGIAVTDEMKILISASAIQVTFGLDKFLFSFSKNIYLPKRILFPL